MQRRDIGGLGPRKKLKCYTIAGVASSDPIGNSSQNSPLEKLQDEARHLRSLTRCNDALGQGLLRGGEDVCGRRLPSAGAVPRDIVSHELSAMKCTSPQGNRCPSPERGIPAALHSGALGDLLTLSASVVSLCFISYSYQLLLSIPGGLIVRDIE